MDFWQHNIRYPLTHLCVSISPARGNEVTNYNGLTFFHYFRCVLKTFTLLKPSQEPYEIWIISIL